MFYRKKKLELPKRCKTCITLNKQAKEKLRGLSSAELFSKGKSKDVNRESSRNILIQDSLNETAARLQGESDAFDDLEEDIINLADVGSDLGPEPEGGNDAPGPKGPKQFPSSGELPPYIRLPDLELNRRVPLLLMILRMVFTYGCPVLLALYVFTACVIKTIKLWNGDFAEHVIELLELDAIDLLSEVTYMAGTWLLFNGLRLLLLGLVGIALKIINKLIEILSRTKRRVGVRLVREARRNPIGYENPDGLERNVPDHRPLFDIREDYQNTTIGYYYVVFNEDNNDMIWSRELRLSPTEEILNCTEGFWYINETKLQAERQKRVQYSAAINEMFYELFGYSFRSQDTLMLGRLNVAFSEELYRLMSNRRTISGGKAETTETALRRAKQILETTPQFSQYHQDLKYRGDSLLLTSWCLALTVSCQSYVNPKDF